MSIKRRISIPIYVIQTLIPRLIVCRKHAVKNVRRILKRGDLRPTLVLNYYFDAHSRLLKGAPDAS